MSCCKLAKRGEEISAINKCNVKRPLETIDRKVSTRELEVQSKKKRGTHIVLPSAVIGQNVTDKVCSTGILEIVPPIKNGRMIEGRTIRTLVAKSRDLLIENRWLGCLPTPPVFVIPETPGRHIATPTLSLKLHREAPARTVDPDTAGLTS